MPTKKCNGISRHKDRASWRLTTEGSFIVGWVITLYTSTFIYYTELKNLSIKKTVLKKVVAVLNLFFSSLATVYISRYRSLVMDAIAGVALTSALLQFDMAFSKKRYTNQDSIQNFVFIMNFVLIVCAAGYFTHIVDDYDNIQSDYSRLCTTKKRHEKTTVITLN